MKVAIQGEKASYHHLAAQVFFGADVHIVPQKTFSGVFTAVDNDKTIAGVVAIENSLYGSINPVYDLLLKHTSEITGEIYLRVEHCLVGLPGTALRDIKEVYSHPVALAQCEEFLNIKLPHARRYEEHDTAASVQLVKQANLKTKAAIASRQAAKLHGLAVLKTNIETNQANYTRFVVIGTHGKTIKPNKTSLVLMTHADTKPGALYKALGAFAQHDINLTMLQSRPIIGRAWHYMFYVDALGDVHSAPFRAALNDLHNLGYNVKILGSYQSGEPSI